VDDLLPRRDSWNRRQDGANHAQEILVENSFRAVTADDRKPARASNAVGVPNPAVHVVQNGHVLKDNGRY
jgi:hypothetical protein